MNRQPNLRKKIALKLFSSLQRDRVVEHKLRTLFWECTLRCNLKCRHCGSDCKHEAEKKDMPAEEFFRVLDSQITPNVDPNKVMIILSGGEVLLRDDLEIIGASLYQRGYPWGIVTNGMALTQERFLSLQRAGLRSITVSFDGFEEEHNYVRGNSQSFKNALRAARLISREPTVAYDIVTCVTPALIPRLEEFRDFLISEGILHWRLFTIFPVGRAANDMTMRLNDTDFRKLLEFIKRTRKEGNMDVSYACEGFLGSFEGDVRRSFYNCSAGVSTASIRIDGAISGCTSIRSEYAQGNIYTDNFWEVWTTGFEKFRNREWTKKGECASCSMWQYCQGGGMHLRDNNGELLVCHYNRLK
ncbi:MAG: TIGR04133 family radical SAM/SPASM protein [Rikenellaceae bacterium]